MTLDKKRFPKIFFANYYSPDSKVLADLIRQLFLGYPADRIAWWYCRRTPAYEKPELKIDNVYCYPIPNKLMPNKKLAKSKSWLLERFWVPLAARHLERSIADAKPDLVWVWLQGWPAFVCTAADLKNYRMHASLWDFPDVNSQIPMLGVERVQRIRNKIYQLIKKSDTYDALCPSSIEEICLNTGRKDGVMVHSGFEPHHLQALEKLSSTPQSGDGILRVAYVGTIISEKGFFKTLAALDTVRKSQSRKIVLEFFGARNYRKCSWFNPEWMMEHGLFTDEGLIEAVRKCTWGIVVMDPEGEDLGYSRFSFPNKVGSYLSAGVPILGFGNPQSCLVKMMQEHNFGRFTTATDAGGLEKFFQESFQIGSPGEKFREGILRCAQTEFNAAEMRARLWKLWGVEGGGNDE